MKKILSVFLSTLMLFLLSIYAVGIKPSQKDLINGIDVSKYQGKIDFKEVKKSGIDIVYIRSSLGKSYVDPYFKTNYKNAKNAGLKVGFYHYVTAINVAQAEEQAKFFVSTLKGITPDCKLAVDFEEFKNLSKKQVNEITIAFAQKVEELSGKETVIYANAYAASYILNKPVTKHPLWIAHWKVNEPADTVIWSEWVGWQYTSTGRVNGIKANVDRNYFTSDIFINDKTPVPPIKPDEKDTTVYYIVKKDDTLWAISKKYSTTVSKLVRLNGIKNQNLIFVGQKLIIKTSEDSINNRYTMYYVKRGDTLWDISRKYGTTISKLARDNNIRNPNRIYVGQVLKIYDALIPQKPPNQGQKIIRYKVKKGDTLWAISRKYGTTISKLVRDNKIANPNRIYAGQILVIKTG